MNRIWNSRFAKPAVFSLCLLPLLVLAWRWQANELGINRIETVARFSGNWTLRLLLASLCITPLRRLPGQSGLIRFRRMTGLFAFFYAALHALHYYAIDVQWNAEIIWEDLRIRRFFIAGMLSLLLMVPLAATSFQAAIRWMGGKRWQLLHRLAYLSAVAGVVHFFWQGKAALWTPIYYGIFLGALLLYRVGYWGLRRRA
ncbi:MAG: sulfoxide reductase heme-binding subunit YedZ [Bryobacterales bacterium]|nr:sulfoxide reductase heme-binding subunit YedZ [Bryobacterales bacterium]